MDARWWRGGVALTCLAWVGLCLLPPVRAQKGLSSPDPSVVLDRIGDYIEQYYSRAQRLVGREQVVEQPIKRDLTTDGIAFRFDNLIRFEWVPPAAGEAPTATMIRELTAVNGRVPKAKDKPLCQEAVAERPEPLVMFLEGEREAYEFKSAGTSRVDGQVAARLDFRERGSTPVELHVEKKKVGKEDCWVTSTVGFPRGRVWVNAETGEVLRLDRFIVGPVDFAVPDEQGRAGGTQTLERWDQSIRFSRFEFADPEERIVLPLSIETVTIYRGRLQPTRVTQRFADYRRFIGGGRLVD
jgi:hypothetical protein